MSSHKPRRCASQDSRSCRPPARPVTVRPLRDFSSRRRLKDLRVYSSFDSFAPGQVSRCYGPPPPPGPPPPSHCPPPPSHGPPPPPHGHSVPTHGPPPQTFSPPPRCPPRPAPPAQQTVSVYGQHGSGGSDCSSPAPSLSSGYLSIYSQDWEEDIWQRADTVTQEELYSNMAELDLETRPRLIRHSDIEKCSQLVRRNDDLWPRRVRHVHCQTQPLLPGPFLLPPDTRQHRWAAQPQTHGACCNRAVSLLPQNRVQFRESREDRTESEEQSQSKIKSFLTWVSSKAGTSSPVVSPLYIPGGRRTHQRSPGLLPTEGWRQVPPRHHDRTGRGRENHSALHDETGPISQHGSNHWLQL